MLTITLHNVLGRVSVSTVFCRDRDLGAFDPGEKVIQLGYTGDFPLLSDDVSELVEIVQHALEKADQRAQERGGWSLMV